MQIAICDYKKIQSEIYNNRSEIIVIAGRWESSSECNKFTSKVYETKQVAIIFLCLYVFYRQLDKY